MSLRCIVCRAATGGRSLCDPCQEAYCRFVRRIDSIDSPLDVVAWAARRAVRLHGQRRKASPARRPPKGSYLVTDEDIARLARHSMLGQEYTKLLLVDGEAAAADYVHRRYGGKDRSPPEEELARDPFLGRDHPSRGRPVKVVDDPV